ncbi:MAG: polyprenyl synthetase family protein [Planctomycetes bacterium]|jgi:octaprenyl-diphosphate synthase|nr:polyprenyl synthetase family protein [Planctomycetota bacterium]MCL4730843.1 polyprenyl synthetase family protein [Planctomycetota bacterium]
MSDAPVAPKTDAAAQAARVILGRLYAPISDELAQVERMYRAELTSDDPYITNLLAYIEDYSGKKLRPALLLLAGKTCGRLTRDHIVLGVVAEMLHTATLVHDDILDDALLRRKRASINALAGNEVSVLLGDHIFSHAFELSLDASTPVGAREFSRAMAKTCFGEIMQVHNRNHFELGEQKYLQIIEGKTAELYATSAMLGAHYAGADEKTARAFYDYGMNLGRAFQIMDDLLDLLGEEALVGKTLGSDIEKGKPTLPLIRHLAVAPEPAREAAIAAARGNDRPRLLRLLHDSGSFKYAAGRAGAFVAQAKKGLEVLPPSELRDLLCEIADFVLSREL